MSIIPRNGAERVDAAAASSTGFPYARKRQLFLIVLAAPAFVYVLAVAVGPIVQGFLYSFESYNLIRPAIRAISSGSTTMPPYGATRRRKAR